MSPNGRLPGLLLIALSLGGFPVGAVCAQIGGPVRTPDPRLDIDIAKPFFDLAGDADFGALTSIVRASATVPAGPVTFVGGVGLSHATIEGVRSNTVLSNLRLGILVGSAEGTQGEFSATLPVATTIGGDDDFAVGTALFSDVEHFEDFLPDLATVSAGFRHVWSGGEEAASWGLRAAGLVTMPTDGEESHTWGRYGAFTLVPLGGVNGGLEVSGIARVSGEGSFSDRTIHFLGASIGFPTTALAPELYLRMPVDSDLSETLDAVVGLRFRF